METEEQAAGMVATERLRQQWPGDWRSPSSAPTRPLDTAGAATAVLRDVNGAKVGTVRFEGDEGGTSVKVNVHGITSGSAFHGFHIHANDASGQCDPLAPTDRSRTSAGTGTRRQRCTVLRAATCRACWCRPTARPLPGR